jgi:hypothetical protein
MSTSHYQRLETGEGKLDGTTVERIAKLFDLETELLYAFDDRSIFQSGDYSMGTVYNQGDIVHHPIDKKLQELYEKQIKLLEEKVKALEQENATLRKG